MVKELDRMRGLKSKKKMKIKVNIPKAKEIVKEKLRRDRKPLLEAQDVLFQRALETSADTTDIVAEKQRLRDITNDVDSMTTEEQLKTKMSVLEE